MKNFNTEMIEKAKAVKSAEELIIHTLIPLL